MNSEKARRSNEKNTGAWNFPAIPDARKWAGAFRQQYELAFDLADAMLAGAARLQTAQLEAAREIQAQNRKNADALTGVTDLRTLMAAQGALASTQWQAALHRLSGMAEIVQKTNMDCARIMESRCVQLGESWKGVVPQYASGEIPAMWRSALEAARMSGETMMRALTGGANWPQATEQIEVQRAKAA